MNLTILTPLTLEYKAIRRHCSNWEKTNIDGTVYEIAIFKGQYETFNIAVSQTGAKTVSAALATENAIRNCKPTLLFLTGIAGGVKDVKIGDVVVANQAYGYESGKETPEGFMARPNVKPFSPSLLNEILSFSKEYNPKEYNVFIGAIASGDKVIASTDSPIYQRIKRHYNDTIALEMEAIGFAEAVYKHPHIHALNIRGISDLLDEKLASDESGTQELAIANAADFLFQFLYQLNPKNLPIMNPKEIAKEVVNIIFPLLKLDSIKEIGNEFKEATNTTIQEMWDKVSPIFIEEFEAEEEEDINDREVQANLQSSIETKLRRTLKKDDSMEKSLMQLLNQAKTEALESKINIANSKNMIIGSTINAGRDAIVGDQTTTTTNNIQQQNNNYGGVKNQTNISEINDAGFIALGNLTIKGKNIAGRDQTINQEKPK